MCVTSWFTHNWSNLIQRMQHAENCGQRFPLEEKKQLGKLPIVCMQVCNCTTSHGYFDTCVVSVYPGGQNCASVAVFFLSNKSPNFVTQTLETCMKHRDACGFKLRCFAVLIQTISGSTIFPPLTGKGSGGMKSFPVIEWTLIQVL